MKIRISIIIVLLSSVVEIAAFESGTYETIFNPTVLEFGDNVPNENRILPRSATITFDLDATPPSLTAVIHDAVLEGGVPFYSEYPGPFELTVRSSSGTQLEDGSYSFSGDYMGDLRPTGTQWGFEWRFSEIGAGIIAWNGSTGWWGGHVWAEIISGIALQVHPQPYQEESIFIENMSFENGLDGWDTGLHGEIITFSSPPRYGLIDGTNVLRILAHEFDTPYRSQTLGEVVRSNSVYVLEVVCHDGGNPVIALQDGFNSTLAEAVGPFDGYEGVYSTFRLIYAVPQGHESIGNPLKIYLGNISSHTGFRADFDHVRLTRYSVSPRLILKLIGDNVTLSATNLMQGTQYEISSVATLTNAWTQVLTFNAEATSTNFTGLIPTNTPSPSGFYKLEWEE